MELSNREIAQAVLLSLGVLLLLVFPRTRDPFFKAIASLSRSFFVMKVLLPLFFYFGYAWAIAFLSYRCGFWNSSLLKETIYVVLLIGLPTLFNAVTSKDGTRIFRRIIRNTLGASALLGFYIALEPLPIWAELILLPFLTTCVVVSMVANLMTGPARQIGTFFEFLAAITGVFLFIFTTIQVIKNFDDYEWNAVLDSFLLSVWFAIALLPFIYVFAFIASCESVLVMLPYFNDRKKPRLRVRMGFIWGLHFSTRFSSLFRGSWRKEIATAETFRDSLEVMKRFRRQVRRQPKNHDR